MSILAIFCTTMLMIQISCLETGASVLHTEMGPLCIRVYEIRTIPAVRLRQRQRLRSSMANHWLNMDRKAIFGSFDTKFVCERSFCCHRDLGCVLASAALLGDIVALYS